MPIKNSSDTIGNRTRDLPYCSAVPKLTAPPRVPHPLIKRGIICRLARSHKMPITFVMSVLPSGHTIRAAPTRRISVKYDIRDFMKIFQENPNLSWRKVSATSREYRSTFYCCRRHSVAINSAVFE